ncbi:MAG: F0F1 ATP synthase subunit gamma [Pseudomonadota bacterium]
MPSLKDLKVRIGSVKSTRKITSSMKMVAAAKLRRAQEQAEAARPYAERMDRMVAQLAAARSGGAGAPPLMVGRGKTDRHLMIVCSADRGLCGSLNAGVARESRRRAVETIAAGHRPKFIFVGKKARGLLRRDYDADTVGVHEDVAKPKLQFSTAEAVAEETLKLWDEDAFDVCTIIYNRFQSAISQEVTAQQLIPLVRGDEGAGEATASVGGAIYEYEPDEDEILRQLLPRNLAVQIFRALLESNASEHGARMTAMDNATRNAGDMIDRLTMTYNRSRQAAITKELIEIISGAEAL